MLAAGIKVSEELGARILHTPAGDLEPTGRPVSLDYIQVLRFRDGKHVSFNLSFDRLAMLDQLGLIPVPAP